jgi:hypothetical protein
MTVQVIALLILALVLGLFIRTFLTRKAVERVIKIFYQQGALGAKSAKTLHELGLEPVNLLQRMTRPRDYRQSALHILITRDIIVANEEGKLYLVEQRLNPSLRGTRNTPRAGRGRS